VTALALFVVALCYFALTATRTLDPRDEGYLLARSAQVLAGEVPHRDFPDVYGPGVFALTAVAMKLGDGEILAVRVLLMLFKAAAVVFGFLISRRLAPAAAASFASLLAIAYWGRLSANLNSPYASLFAIPLCLGALWLLLRALERRSWRGHLAAGLVAGAAILFKQSLGLMVVYGMALAIWGATMLEPGSARQERTLSARRWTSFCWLAAGLLVLAPASSYLGARDYLLHFLAMHVLVAGVAVSAWRRGGPPGLSAGLGPGLVPFGVGAALAPTAALVLYAYWGSLGALLQDMFIEPLSRESYYVAAVLPPLGLGVAVLGAAALVTAMLAALGGRRRGGWVLGAVGVLALATGRFAIPSEYPRLFEAATLGWRAPFALEGVLAPCLLLGAAGLALARLSRSADEHAPRALLPVLFVSSMLCYEVFPRAGPNLWILHGTLSPLFALVLDAGYRLALRPDAQRWRRLAAAALLAVLPLWLVAPIVRPVVAASEPASERRALTLARTQGLAFGPRQIEQEHLADLERLIDFLRAAEPPDAPLLVMSNEALIPLLAERRQLFERESYSLFLAGWGMLSAAALQPLDSEPMLERLRATPEVLIVHRRDATAANLRRALPRIRRFVEQNFEVVARFGVYHVLRRSTPSD
jgi:hypothetical protein